MCDQIWMQESYNFAVCTYCHSQIFGMAYRKWKDPKLIGNNVIYEKTEIKICGCCHKNLIRVEHEKRNHRIPTVARESRPGKHGMAAGSPSARRCFGGTRHLRARPQPRLQQPGIPTARRVHHGTGK